VIVQPSGEWINRIYGYCRTCGSDHKRSGRRRSDQEHLLKIFSMNRFQRPIDQFFTDTDIPGGINILERPASRELTDILEPRDVVLVTALDRLSRSTKDLLYVLPQLEATGVSLYFTEQFGDIPLLGPGEQSQILRMTLAAVSEIENGLAQDLRATRKMQLREEGFFIGGRVPYGYRLESEWHDGKERQKLVPVPEELHWREVITKMHKRGLSSRKIAKQIDALDPNRDWTYRKVDRIIHV
jgi:putative DNA-invertase from lambdoid prophage Rac